jgi:hypothetical protein
MYIDIDIYKRKFKLSARYHLEATSINIALSPEYASDLIFCSENLPLMQDDQRAKLLEKMQPACTVFRDDV